MALSAFVPNIWSARFLSKLRANLVWEQLGNRNYQGEITAAGDTVKIPTGTSNIAIGDYVSGTKISANPSVANGTTQDLDIDKQKFFRFLVDDIQRVQSKPDIMDEAINEAAFKIANQIDSDIMTEVNTAEASARRERVATAMTSSALRKTAVEAILKAMIDQKNAMSSASIPLEDRWFVIHPDTLSLFEEYFLVGATTGTASLFLPVTTEDTLRNGFAGKMLGYNMYVTTKVPSVTVSSTDYHILYMGQGRENFTHAAQISEMEVARPDDLFADLVKGLYVYGTKTVHPGRLYNIQHIAF